MQAARQGNGPSPLHRCEAARVALPDQGGGLAGRRLPQLSRQPVNDVKRAAKPQGRRLEVLRGLYPIMTHKTDIFSSNNTTPLGYCLGRGRETSPPRSNRRPE